ncbi:putative inorganic carbon transporter subunit DabA, partial [Anoxybacillus sp. LAT_11]|uniref:putative inorganic carbon transporter subunit DabA n=1 Tax=Anoxybacillus sp. LAT_11 TaxID=2862718 RepID=UPI001EECD283
MNTTTVSLEHPNVRKQRREDVAVDINVRALVKSASQAIAPLWPIAAFVARHPWMGLEHFSFEQVAHR